MAPSPRFAAVMTVSYFICGIKDASGLKQNQITSMQAKVLSFIDSAIEFGHGVMVHLQGLTWCMNLLNIFQEICLNHNCFKYFKAESTLFTRTISTQNVKMLMFCEGRIQNSLNMKKHFVLSPALAHIVFSSSTFKTGFPGVLCVFHYFDFFFQTEESNSPDY